jgi:hypothetical protein
MKLDIEPFTSGTDWSESSALVSVEGINEIPEFVAGLNSKSLIFKFSSGSNGEDISKAVYFDLTEYDEIVFWVWSRNKRNTGIDYNDKTGYAYKIDFGTGKEYFIPLFNSFSDVTVSIKGMGVIDTIKITCLHDEEDHLIMSQMVAVRDEIPVDIWRSVKEQLEADILTVYPNITGGVSSKGILLGTISGSAGGTSILFSDSIKIAEKYSVILIEDGDNSETHQLDGNDGLSYSFFTTYDGPSLKHDYTSAAVYLIIPVEFGMSESEINLPGINIQGMNPEEIIDSSKIDHARDTFDEDDTVSERRADAKFRYIILIDCEARTNEMIAFMSLLVRYFLARQVLWVNGKRIEILPEGASTYIEPQEAFNQIPKIQYTMQIEIREEVYTREKLFDTLQNTRTFNLRR